MRSPHLPKAAAEGALAVDNGRSFSAFRAKRTISGANYHAIPVGGHSWTRAVCGSGPGTRSAGWTVMGDAITCPRCQQRLKDMADQVWLHGLRAIA